jgi:hypothetical protein
MLYIQLFLIIKKQNRQVYIIIAFMLGVVRSIDEVDSGMIILCKIVGESPPMKFFFLINQILQSENQFLTLCDRVHHVANNKTAIESKFNTYIARSINAVRNLSANCISKSAEVL